MKSMKIRHSSYMLATFACALLLASATSRAADSEPKDIDEGMLAKISKTEVKSNREKAKQGGGNEMDSMGQEPMSSSDSNCDINIGNNTGSQKGSSALNNRDSTVIVTGPVINTGKCTKH
jgi:hypothetical protein